MRFKPPSRIAASLLILGVTVITVRAPGGPRTGPRVAQSVSDETALWLLAHARARLSSSQAEATSLQQSAPEEAREHRESFVFVTPYLRGCVICPSPAAGGGDSLAAALNSALGKIPAAVVSSDLTSQPLQREPERIQIDILEGRFFPLSKPEETGPHSDRPSAAEFLDPGVDGLAIDAPRRTVYLLPNEMLYRGTFDEDPTAQSVEGLLNRAMTQVGFDEYAWRSPHLRLSRFHTVSFIEDRKSAGVIRIVRGILASPEPDRSGLMAAARAGGDYLIRMQQPDGRFHYSYDPMEDRENRRSYNILRHAGTAISLFDLYGTTRETRYLDAARRATAFLRSRFRPSDPGGSYVLDNDGKAKLGANGLALLALDRQQELDPHGSDRAGAERLANQIVNMQGKDGSFASYHPIRGDEPDGSVSLYYPGEAILGLVRLYTAIGNRRLLAAARRGADYLIESQRKLPALPPDAWLMQALEALHRIGGERKFADHALALADAMVAEQYGPDDPAGYAGGFRPGLPRATPAASRAEGLLAAYRLAVTTGDSRASKIAAALRASARFQLSQQFTRVNSFFLPNPERAAGGFRASITSMRIRIDFVQHNISSLLGIAQALY